MTISEYILENDISFASVDDIEIAKCFAEMTVLGSLVEAYSKYETICEYTTTNPAEFNIIMESATEVVDAKFAEVKDEDIKSNAKSTKEKWYKSLWAWIKKLITTIMNHFTRLDIKKLIKMLTKLKEKQPNGAIDFPVGKAHDVGLLLNIFEDFIKTVGKEHSENDINKIYERVEELNSSNKETVKLPFSKVISKLKDLDMGDVVSRCKEISDIADRRAKDMMSKPDDYVTDDVARYAATIKKTTAAISKLYTTNMNAFLDAQTRIIKEYKKSHRK